MLPERGYTVQPHAMAQANIRILPSVGARTKARQSLIDRQPFPNHFATFTEATTAARGAGPEFEVVVSS